MNTHTARTFVPALLLVAGVVVGSVAQPPAAPAPKPATGSAPARVTPAAPAAEFPISWKGHWKGDSRQFIAGGKGFDFKMELIVGELKEGRAPWTIVYDGAAGRQERPYELVVRSEEKDKGKGRFAVDEKQGIVIEMTLLDGGLYGLFFVQDAQIAVSYKLLGAGTKEERIEVEMMTTRTSDGKQTGGKDEVPVVQTYPPVSVQKAVLRRS